MLVVVHANHSSPEKELLLPMPKCIGMAYQDSPQIYESPQPPLTDCRVEPGVPPLSLLDVDFLHSPIIHIDLLLAAQ